MANAGFGETLGNEGFFSKRTSCGGPQTGPWKSRLAVPRTATFSNKEDATEFFNVTLCNLFLGGVLCGAVDTRDVVWGKLHSNRHLWPVDFGESVSSQLHAQLRTRVGGGLNTIVLSDPPILALSTFRDAFSKGADITNSIPSLSPKFFLVGVTELRNRNWSSALSNLWIVIEQLTDHLWNEAFLNEPRFHPTTEVAKRKRAMKEDNRTWSTSVKHEFLYQKVLISENSLSMIFPARQARNALVHGGKNVSSDSAISACEGAINLMKQCSKRPFEIESTMYLPPDDELRRGKPIPGEPRFDLWKTAGRH